MCILCCSNYICIIIGLPTVRHTDLQYFVKFDKRWIKCTATHNQLQMATKRQSINWNCFYSVCKHVWRIWATKWRKKKGYEKYAASRQMWLWGSDWSQTILISVMDFCTKISAKMKSVCWNQEPFGKLFKLLLNCWNTRTKIHWMEILSSKSLKHWNKLDSMKSTAAAGVIEHIFNWSLA